jgi:hypothetical protein
VNISGMAAKCLRALISILVKEWSPFAGEIPSAPQAATISVLPPSGMSQCCVKKVIDPDAAQQSRRSSTSDSARSSPT